MPPDVCPVLYSSLSEEGALAEMTYRQSLLNPIPTKPVLIHTLQISLTRVARLTYDDLQELGIDNGTYHEPNYTRTQEIGDAVWFLDCDGLIVPSARWKCDNLVIFFDKLSSPETSVSVVDSEEIDWIQWANENGISIANAE